jgi:hypothetical protein
MLLASTTLLSTPGNYWSWYVVTAPFAIVPIFKGTKRQRSIGAIALILCIVLIVFDLVAGVAYRAQRRERVARIWAARQAATNNDPQR